MEQTAGEYWMSNDGERIVRKNRAKVFRLTRGTFELNSIIDREPVERDLWHEYVWRKSDQTTSNSALKTSNTLLRGSNE